MRTAFALLTMFGIALGTTLGLRQSSSDELTAQVIQTAVDIKVRYDVFDPITGELKRMGVGGSGVLISPYGHILTCAHLFDDKPGSIEVLLYQDQINPVRAELIIKDVYKDLALLKIARRTPYAPLARWHSTKVGEDVIAVGSPLGFAWSVSRGIVSATNRRLGGPTNVNQVDASVNPGNSGGPLFNMDGELVGINVSIISPVPAFTGLAFSVSIEEIRQFLFRFKGLEQVI